MRKICKYDSHHWLMYDENKNLLLMNEKTGQIYDFSSIQPERSKREDLNNGFFPPPWNPNEFPEKTKGWLEFQKEMKKDPEYYLGCGSLNSMET
jgi:hypothetical protein